MDVNLLAGKVALANIAQSERVAHSIGGFGRGGVLVVVDIADIVDAVS